MHNEKCTMHDEERIEAARALADAVYAWISDTDCWGKGGTTPNCQVCAMVRAYKQFEGKDGKTNTVRD